MLPKSFLEAIQRKLADTSDEEGIGYVDRRQVHYFRGDDAEGQTGVALAALPPDQISISGVFEAVPGTYCFVL